MIKVSQKCKTLEEGIKFMMAGARPIMLQCQLVMERKN